MFGVRCCKISPQSLQQKITHIGMLQLNQSQVAIHFCTFQAYLEKAKVNLRFPSLFFVEWKTINGKNSVGMVGRRRATNSLIDLNETLTFNTEMLYHRAQKQYLKKQSLFHLNLISNSRPDQVKLVGRVVIDLSQIANSNKYAQVTTSKLMYCSVDADISFSLRLARSIQSNLELNDLDRSSFSDLYSFTSPIRAVGKNKMETKDGLADRRMEEERRRNKYKLSEREEIGYNPRNSKKEVRTQNILIEESEERSVPQSLPLTEKKPALNMLQEIKMEVNQPEEVKNVVDTGFQARIYQEKDILQRELNDHKNKIKKLEVDIKEAMKLFQQSQQNSEINRSKLVESEEIINNLKVNEAKLRDFYQKEIEKTKELGSRQLQLTRTSYEADKKILLATIEELKFKTHDLESMQRLTEEHKILQQENSELLKKLKNNQDMQLELQALKAQIAKYSDEKQHFLEQLKRKDYEVLNLSQQNNQIKASNYNIQSQFNELKLELDNKIAELQTIKEESTKAKQLLTVEPTKEALPSVSFLDPQQLQNYQKLQEEHKKLTLQLETLKKSILFPEQYKKAEKQNVDLFVIIQKSQLQDIQISQLKQENATMREKMQQLVQEHQQLKTQRSGNESKYNTELETEQFNLLKEQFMLVKEENQKYVESIQMLKEEIKDLKHKLSSKSTQLETFELLKMQLLDVQKENTRLNTQLQSLKKTEIPAQNNGLITLKPVKCEVSQVKENIELQGHHETEQVLIPIQQDATNNHHQTLHEASPAKQNSGHKSIGLLDEHHDHQHHDFNFEQHASPLTHDELNKMLEVKEVNRDEMQYLMDEIFKLKEEIEELKTAKCYRKSQTDLGLEQNNQSIDELNKLQDSLKQLKQQNESLKGEIQALKQHQSNLISQQQHKETISVSNAAFTEQMQQLQKQNQDHQKTIFDLECHLQQLQKRHQQLENQLKISHDPFERQNNYIRQLEAKIANLEEEMKIKDDLLAQGERNIEENYTIKYQLADLKDKFSEIKSALQEKEEVINYLEEAKEQLSKELQQVGDKERSRFIIEPKQIMIETPKNEVDYTSLQAENADLKNEIQALKQQLVSMNNNQIELRNLSEAESNQRLSAEREKEEQVKKFQEAMTRVSQLQAQVNEFSFMINGLNVEIEKNKEEINSLNEQVNTRSLKNDQIVLQVEDLRSKNEELSNKIKIIQSQSAFIGAQPLPESINNNQMDSLKAKYAEKEEEVRQKQERLAQLNSELQAARQKIEELTAQNQSLLLRIQTEAKGEVPFVAVHEVGSAIEPAPVDYEKSIIPLYEREELQRIEKNLTDQQIQDQDSLKKQLEEVKKMLEKETSQKNSYYNALEIANSKIIELQIQAMTLKEQIQKFTSLPIQSYNHMATPVKQQPQNRQADASAKSIREPSIINQPRVKGEISELSAIINPPEKEANQSPQKNPFSKNIETRVDTNVINEEQADSIKKQLQILKQELESQQKLHQQLREIHNICEKKYELLNNHYENCLEQLNNFKAENGGLITEKQNLANELYFVKDAYMSLQNEHDSLLAIHNKLTQEPQKNNNDEIPVSTAENNNTKVNQGQFVEQKRQYQQRLLEAVKNEEKLTHKIQLLQENILNLQKSLQDHIELSQSNDKITQKLQQLNELQTVAAQFKQQIQQAKQEKQQLALIQVENEQLKKEVSEMLKIVDQHKNCSSQKSEWQAKLLNIEHMLSDNETRYAGEKQELEHKLFALAEEKASLVAEVSAIQENIKQGSQIVVENHEEVPQKQVQLHSEMQELRNEKLNQMQRVADLQEKLNNEQQSRSKRQAELQQAVIVREQQVEQLKFINIQLHQQLDEVKAVASQHQQCTKQIQSLQSKVQEQANLTGQYEMLIHNLREQVNDLSNKNDNSGELERIRAELLTLQEEISQKIILIEQQQQKIAQLTHEQENNRKQLANLQDQSEKNQQEFAKNIEESNKLRDDNKELLALKTKIENELKAVNSRYSELENAIKNNTKLTDARDKNLETLKNQSSKKEKQITDLNKKIKTKETDIVNLTKQLDTLRIRNQENQAKIRQLSQKQRLMKQTMNIVEQQSIKIVQSLKSRYESEEIYYRQCLQKQKENNRLALAVVQIRQQLENKERILTYEEERINQLTNQIEFLKKKGETQPEAISNAVTIEYQKYEKLMEKNDQLLSKNREYLEIISNKSASTLENEKLKRQAKQLLQKLTEYQQSSIENQRKLDQKVPELEKQLIAINILKNELADKVENLQRQLQQAKEANIKNTHALIENIIMEKDKQISSLKNGSKKVKDSDILESNDDISILNQQILNLNRQILEKDNQLNKLKTEINVSKPLTASENVHFDEQKEKLINELHERQRREEEYKESIRKLREQLKSGLPSPKQNGGSPSNEAKHVQQVNTISNQLHHLCEEIKQLSLKRSSPEQSDKLYQALIQKYDQMQQQFGSLSNETSVIQQKAKFISKELQKIKSFIIKSQNRSFKEKTELLALIKPCQNAASQMVNISQTLSDKQSQNFI